MFEKEYAMTRVRAMKGRLLGEHALQNIRQAKTKESLAASVHRSLYEKVFSGLEDVKKEDLLLDVNLFEAVQKIHRFMPGSFENDMNVVMAKWDLENLKIIIRHLYAKKQGCLQESLFPDGAVFRLFSAGGITDLESLGNELKNTKHYAAYMAGYLKFRETGMLRDLELAVDRACASACKKATTKELEEYVRLVHELEDFCALMRLEKCGHPDETQGLNFPKKASEILKKYELLRKTPGSKEEAAEKYILGWLKERTTADPFSFFVVIEYLMKKEREIRNVQASAREVIA